MNVDGYLEGQNHGGLTIVDQLWQKLDGAYARWRRYRKHGEKLPDGISLDYMKGRVEGLVEALAILTYPATVDGVKAECLKRWKDRQPAS